jgi:chromosome segregation ATPase
MPEDGRQDEQDERSVDERIKSAVEAAVNQTTEAFQSKLNQQAEQFKGEIAGLNRRNSELENALKTKEDETMTVEQQIQQLRDERRADQQASALREKRLTWRAKAAELHIDDPTLVEGIDGTKSLEDGVSYIEKLAETAQNIGKQLANDTLAKAGYKPGSGATDHEEGATPPDPSSLSFSDLNQMSDDQLESIGRSDA